MVTLRKGFTLIELMIVIAIVGIIAAVAIPKIADLINSEEIKYKVTYQGKTEVFEDCYQVDSCNKCKRDDGSKIKICGQYTVEKLELN